MHSVLIDSIVSINQLSLEHSDPASDTVTLDRKQLESILKALTCNAESIGKIGQDWG